MTNKEKAIEIAENNFTFYKSNVEGEISTDSCKECEQSALEMAEWKDQQFKKVLHEVEIIFNNKSNPTDFGVQLSIKIIKDKLNLK